MSNEINLPTVEKIRADYLNPLTRKALWYDFVTDRDGLDSSALVAAIAEDFNWDALTDAEELELAQSIEQRVDEVVNTVEEEADLARWDDEEDL